MSAYHLCIHVLTQNIYLQVCYKNAVADPLILIEFIGRPDIELWIGNAQNGVRMTLEISLYSGPIDHRLWYP